MNLLMTGMLTAHSPDAAPADSTPSHAAQELTTASPNEEPADQTTASRSEILWVTVLSIAAFALGIGAVVLLEGKM